MRNTSDNSYIKENVTLIEFSLARDMIQIIIVLPNLIGKS